MSTNDVTRPEIVRAKHVSITLDIPSRLEKKLREAAKLRGVTAEEHAVQILDAHLPLTVGERRENYRAWIQSVREEGDEEGECSWDEILQRMDESRVQGRKLFPPEMKGITW